ncbi:MAG TPA: PIN domain-containing protein [Actinomycetes bacterium]|nr:PIN domain-containing protein [Actinomycetes bacterium]
MTVLADTSVWVQYLRQGRAGTAARLDDLLTQGEVVVCGPVVAELVAGTAPARRGELVALLNALPWADLGRAEWARVGEVAARLREQGITTALTDIEIAVAAVRSHAELWTHDSDFAQIAKVLDSLALFTP